MAKLQLPRPAAASAQHSPMDRFLLIGLCLPSLQGSQHSANTVPQGSPFSDHVSRRDWSCTGRTPSPGPGVPEAPLLGRQLWEEGCGRCWLFSLVTFPSKQLPWLETKSRGWASLGVLLAGSLGFLLCSDKDICPVRPSSVRAEAPSLQLHTSHRSLAGLGYTLGLPRLLFGCELLLRPKLKVSHDGGVLWGWKQVAGLGWPQESRFQWPEGQSCLYIPALQGHV